MRRALLLASVLASLALAGGALAAEVVTLDDQGRRILFDVRVEGVNAEWYAALLRAAPHGNEIAAVRIEIVSREELRSTCGPNAGGCYSRNVMVVPAGQDAQIAHTLLLAEDYARLALAETIFRIGWLEPPDGTVLAALQADLGLGPPPAILTRPR